MNDRVPMGDFAGGRYRGKIYANSGNRALIAQLSEGARLVLDIGCGAGDNARLLSARCDLARIWGITMSSDEASIARQYMEQCLISDVEGELPAMIASISFDAIICSHVLEHLREPDRLVTKLYDRLRPSGELLIAVPNVLAWRTRFAFFRGKFEYQEHGVLDETHLRFFTFRTADAFLLRRLTQPYRLEKSADGSVPLWILRRSLFPERFCRWLDRAGCMYFPNLFGDQVLLKITKGPLPTGESERRAG